MNFFDSNVGPQISIGGAGQWLHQAKRRSVTGKAPCGGRSVQGTIYDKSRESMVFEASGFIGRQSSRWHTTFKLHVLSAFEQGALHNTDVPTPAH